MLRFPRRAVARFVALLRSDFAGVRAGFFALLISSGGDLVTGLTLASITHTLTVLPGLFILIPAAIGMRGNIFGGLGQPARHPDPRRNVPRLAPDRHALRPERRRRDRAVARRSRRCSRCSRRSCRARCSPTPTISVVDFMVISVIGAILSSIVVLVITVAVAAFCARRSLDLDNVAAPIVTAAGDIATLPSLYVATYLIGYRFVTPVIAILCVALAVGSLVYAAALEPPDPAPHRARVAADPRARRRGRPDGRRDDPEAPRVVRRVPGAAGARARVPRGLRVARARSWRPGSPPSCTWARSSRAGAPGGPRSTT